MNSQLYILLIISIAGTGLIIIGFILVQVHNQKKMLEKQRQLAAAELKHQKDLLEAVITSQETERQRIGSDLHDEVGTVLSSLRILIEKYESPAQDVASEAFNLQSKEMIDRVIRNVRQIAHNLSPHISGDHGLYDALQALCDAVNLSSTVRIATLFDEDSIPKNLPEATALSLYRVLAELMNNTLKHADAKNITIRIETMNNKLHVMYTDNGIGFLYDSVAVSTGMGLQNIESRISVVGGTYKINSSPGKGMEVSLSIPQHQVN
ncbi:MAG TPA: sensor histidine kinase [Chitinophagaceae bacterium]